MSATLFAYRPGKTLKHPIISFFLKNSLIRRARVLFFIQIEVYSVLFVLIDYISVSLSTKKEQANSSESPALLLTQSKYILYLTELLTMQPTPGL